ncbi:hypothetical protein L9F63_015773, partial [Diploptera punctata]
IHGLNIEKLPQITNIEIFFYFGRHWPLLIVSDKMMHLNEFEVYHALHLLRQGQSLRQRNYLKSVPLIFLSSVVITTKEKKLNRNMNSGFHFCALASNDRYRIFSFKNPRIGEKCHLKPNCKEISTG